MTAYLDAASPRLSRQLSSGVDIVHTTSPDLLDLYFPFTQFFLALTDEA
jgi:hypothetical protein